MIYLFEDCALDIARRELRRGGKACHIEPQVFDLLRFLVENRARAVSRDEIFQAVWQGRFVSDAALSTRINAARAVVGDDGKAQRLIRTLRQTGFRFIGDVREDHPQATALPAPSKPRLVLNLPGAPVLVIHPFCCWNDKTAEPLARGLSMLFMEECIGALCGNDWLHVVVRTAPVRDFSAVALKGWPHKLGAEYLLHGSLHQGRDHLWILIRLVDGVSGIHLWAQRYLLEVAVGADLQADIIVEIAKAASDHIFAAEQIRAQAGRRGRADAWQAIVAALRLIKTRERAQVAAAQTLLKKIVAADDKCASTLALLSFVTSLGVHQGWVSRLAARDIAREAAARAIVVDEGHAWSHVAAGYAELQAENRPETAIDLFQRALTLDPNLAMAHYLIALASTYTGNTDAAFRHADMAERLAPLDLLARGNAGVHDNVRATASFVAGRYRDGITFALKAIAESPRQVSAHRQLLLNSAMAGEIAEAAKALRTVQRLAPEIQRYLDERESLWNRRIDAGKYAEAFRIAGHR